MGTMGLTPQLGLGLPGGPTWLPGAELTVGRSAWPVSPAPCPPQGWRVCLSTALSPEVPKWQALGTACPAEVTFGFAFSLHWTFFSRG